MATWIWILLLLQVDTVMVQDYEECDPYPTIVLRAIILPDKPLFRSYSSPWNERLKEEYRKNPNWPKPR